MKLTNKNTNDFKLKITELFLRFSWYLKQLRNEEQYKISDGKTGSFIDKVYKCVWDSEANKEILWLPPIIQTSCTASF